MAAQATRDLFSRRESSRPDAVFVANDHMVFAVLDVLRNELELHVPNNVQVIGGAIVVSCIVVFSYARK